MILLGSHFVSTVCSRSIQFALTILLVGVGIATVTDLQLNVLGSVLSVLAVITTCIAQIVSFLKAIEYTHHSIQIGLDLEKLLNSEPVCGTLSEVASMYMRGS